MQPSLLCVDPWITSSDVALLSGLPCISSIDVNQFLGSAQGALASLLERYSGAKITEKLANSILATVTRQLVIHSCIHFFFHLFFYK